MSYSYDNQHLGGTPPKKKFPLWLILVIIAGSGLLVLCAVGSVAALSASGARPTPTTKAAPVQPIFSQGPSLSPSPSLSPTPTKSVPPPPPPAPSIADGTWTVGEDIPAGVYRTVGADSSCYWEIDKSGSNGDDIINNHVGGGNLRVTLKKGQDFETERCGTWTKIG
jgi:hypothetical protein